MRALKQLIFGWDTSIGIWCFMALSFTFNKPADLWLLAAAFLFSYLPDLDFIPFLALRRRLNVTVGHWVFGHYPLILLPVEIFTVMLITNEISPEQTLLVVSLAVSCTVGHFLHDAWAKPHGFHLLAPITKDGRIQFPTPWTAHPPQDLYTHYRIGWGSIISEAPREEVEKGYADTAASTTSVGNEIESRVEPVTTAQAGAFGIGILGMLALILKNGWVWPI